MLESDFKQNRVLIFGTRDAIVQVGTCVFLGVSPRHGQTALARRATVLCCA
jgi:hypothetical protein